MPVLTRLLRAGESLQCESILRGLPGWFGIEEAASRHGYGLGTALLRRAEEVLNEEGVSFLQVKTLGPSRSDAGYERTRRFYSRMGFLPLEENRLWGETNPCLIMIKHLCCSTVRQEVAP